MRRLSMFAGLVSVASGAFLIWMLYGFATMMNPDTPNREAAIWSRVISDEWFGFGIFLICIGLWLAIKKPKPSPSRP